MSRRYLALFRGINVGGRNMVKMAELKRLFVELGFDNVQTYINSGNVLFDSALSADQAAERIKPAFQAAFGFAAAVMLRSREEIAALVSGLPFAAAQISEMVAAQPQVEHLYVYFLNQPPLEAELERLQADYGHGDVLAPGERELYLLSQGSIRDSRLANALTQLGAEMTARNWKTVSKLEKLLEQ